ncbi:hypothetical protein BvCmsNSNP012_01219 [Escherichia coli]|nr:hypothetical protein [Escherichia coli]GDO96995.1 hypothetical protein BvCmsNSNP012_01219 [Escherichia coli]
MWIFIFWLSSSFNVYSGNVVRRTSLIVHRQEFSSEKKGRDAFTALKKENVGELTLRAFVLMHENEAEMVIRRSQL